MTIAITPEKALIAIFVVGGLLPIVFGGCSYGPRPDPYDPRPHDGDMAELAYDSIVSYAQEKAKVAEAAATKLERGQFKSSDDLHQWKEAQTEDALKAAFSALSDAEQSEIGERYDQKRAARMEREQASGFRRVR